MARIIVKYTNEEGRRKVGNMWADTNEEEIYKLLGIFLLAGVYLSKNETVVQLWNKEHGRPIFSRMMSRIRFQLLTSNLRFDSKETREERSKTDKLAPFSTVWEMFILKCKANYEPHEDVTVDEQLVTFRGRCSFKMYIPSKPGRYGIKIWVLADAINHYCINAEVYTGRKGAEREKKQGCRVVLELTQHLANSGRNVVSDNFFSSYELIQCLENRNMTFLGTIRRNKPELPPLFQSPQNRAVGTCLFGFYKQVAIVSYVPKKGKVVNLISSSHTEKKINEDSGKPEMIHDYNRLKGGVDTLDQLVRNYSCQRRTRRWPMALFYNMVDMAAYNSMVIFKDVNRTGVLHSHRRAFLIQLAEDLAGVSKGSFKILTNYYNLLLILASMLLLHR